MERLPVVFVLLACAACSTAPLPIASSASSQATATPESAAAEVSAGLTFGRPSPADLRTLQIDSGLSGGKYYLPFRPGIVGAFSSAKQLQSGNYAWSGNFRSPFGEGEGIRTLQSAQVTAPAGGDLSAYAQAVIQPIIRTWAADGALFSRYDFLPNLGEMRAGIAPAYDPAATADEASIVVSAGWPLAYLSSSRHEALLFYATGLVVRVGWAPQRHTEASVPVNEAAAIRNMVAALRDPAAVSEEARSGLDYFLGVPYAGIVPPVPEVNRHDELVPTYDVPEGVDWHGTFYAEFIDRPFWTIGSTWGGGGYVDALTGKVIRFTRMRVGHPTGGPPSPYVPPAL